MKLLHENINKQNDTDTFELIEIKSWPVFMYMYEGFLFCNLDLDFCLYE